VREIGIDEVKNRERERRERIRGETKSPRSTNDTREPGGEKQRCKNQALEEEAWNMNFVRMEREISV
jgi:hypothetical protein